MVNIYRFFGAASILVVLITLNATKLLGPPDMTVLVPLTGLLVLGGLLPDAR